MLKSVLRVLSLAVALALSLGLALAIGLALCPARLSWDLPGRHV